MPHHTHLNPNYLLREELGMETSNATEHHRLRVFFTGEKQGQDLLAVKDQEMDICKL